jgi:rhodanese-related sulfurtransferase
MLSISGIDYSVARAAHKSAPAKFLTLGVRRIEQPLCAILKASIYERIKYMEFTLQTPMREVEARYPFSRSLLHSRFHVGGCASCGYEPQETIAEVAVKHSKDADAMLSVLNAGLESLAHTEITGAELKSLFAQSSQTCAGSADFHSASPVLLIDVREKWEHELVTFGQGEILLTEANMEKTFADARQTPHVIVYCHHGLRSLNAALYMREHGIEHARSLRGGIDLYAKEHNANLSRY